MHFMHALSAICVKGGFASKMSNENAFETFGWNVYDFSGTWASPQDRCIAITTSSKVKAS
jgi:hypothetical protein